MPETCSPTCQAVLVKTKRRANIADEVRICKWCGKEFHPKEVRDVYCAGPHYKKCAVCGKEFEVDVRRDQYVETCSKECMGRLMSQNHDYAKGMETQRKNLMEKYGPNVTNPMQIPGAIEKIKQATFERCGSKWYTQTEKYKEKTRKTCLERYGVDHHLKSREVIDKRIQTNLERYGCENVFQAEEIKEKSKHANLEKYGCEYNSQSPEVQALIKSRNIAKYGVKHAMMLKEYQDKAVATNLERYGRRAYTQKHIENIKKFLQDDSIDLSKTEREIMIEHGFVQVYDCGTVTWEWRRERK